MSGISATFLSDHQLQPGPDVVDRADLDIHQWAGGQHDLPNDISVMSVSILLARLGQATQIMPLGAIADVRDGMRAARSTWRVTKISTRSRWPPNRE